MSQQKIKLKLSVLREDGVELFTIPLSLTGWPMEHTAAQEVSMKEDQLIPIKSAPTIAKVSRRTLDRWKGAGQIPYTKIGRAVFFKESVLLSIRKEIHLKGSAI